MVERLKNDIDKETSAVENIRQKEKEKIERTLADARHLVEVGENYLKMIRKCNEKDLRLKRDITFEAIRGPGKPAGPDSDLGKISSMFEMAQAEVWKQASNELQSTPAEGEK